MRSASSFFFAMLAVLLILGAPLAAQAPPAADIVIRDAWVREAAVGQATTAAYLVIENRSSSPTALIAAKAAFATTAELHTMKMTGGSMPGMGDMMTMERVPEVQVPAKGIAELKPGSFHVMLFKITTPLVVGSTVPLTLEFKGGATRTVNAKVMARSATAPMAH